MNDVGVVLNFDARGRGGPAIMFETSPGNQRLIQQFAAAAPYPVANSLSYGIYKLLPNDTDLTVFKEKGLGGFNFAYIDGDTHYHTMLDTPANLDERSLQHQGTYALSLARRLGGEDAGSEQGDAVYFDLFGRLLIAYPGGWVGPLLAVILLAYGAVALMGFRNGYLTAGGLALGVSASLLNAALTAGLVWLVWRATEALRRAAAGEARADAYYQNVYLLGLVSCGVAATLALHLLFRKKVRAQSLAFGALTWWLALSVATTVFMPEASYVFVWPLLFGLVALSLLFGEGRWEAASAKNLLAMWLCALPGIFLLVPIVYLIFAAMGFGALVGVALVLALLCGLLVPQLEVVLGGRRAWLLPVAAAATGAALLAAGSYVSRFDERHPRSSNIFYALDGDASKAVWAGAATAGGPDEWSARFLSAGSARGSIAEYVPQRHLSFISHSAPAAPLAPPDLALVEDAAADGARTLRLRVRSQRQAPVLMLQVLGDALVEEAAVGGKRIEIGRPVAPAAGQPNWRLQYYAPPPEGIDVTLRVNSTEPLRLQVIDRSYGLPALPGVSTNERPAWLMPAAWQLYSDQTLVDKTFTF